jgi:hypothetical protein
MSLGSLIPLRRSEPIEYGAPDWLFLESAAGDASYLRDAQGEPISRRLRISEGAH